MCDPRERNPLISVIVPTHNYGRFIGDALQSACAQTYANTELIVVDDGSTDDTKARLAPFETRVQYIYQPNRGPAAARNTGIQAARGAYLAFLDADDVWLPHKLERQLDALGHSVAVGGAYCWCGFMDERGQTLPQIIRSAHDGPVLEALLLGHFFYFDTSLVRRECFDRAGLMDATLKNFEDWDMALRIAQAGHEFVAVPEVLVRKRVHAYSITHNRMRLTHYERRVLDRAVKSLPPAKKWQDITTAAYRRYFIGNAIMHFRDQNWREGLALLGAGASLQPQVLTYPGLYLRLLEGLLPWGYQSPEAAIGQLNSVAPRAMQLVRQFLSSPDQPPAIRRRRRLAWSSCMLAFAIAHARARHWSKATGFLAKAVAAQPLGPFIAALVKLRHAWSAHHRDHGWRRTA